MDEKLATELSFLLMGLAAVLTGAEAVRLPAGRRLEGLLALVIGAGVGVTGLALGSSLGGMDVEEQPVLFFCSSLAGFVAVVAALVMIHRRTA